MYESSKIKGKKNKTNYRYDLRLYFQNNYKEKKGKMKDVLHTKLNDSQHK